MATSQQSQRHAQHHAYQPVQQATQHRQSRDGGVDPSIPTSESDTDRPLTYISDVRKMAPADKAMESLTTYHVTKLVKRYPTMNEHSQNGAKPWEKAKVIIEDSLSQEEILEGLNEAGRKDGKSLRDRTADYPEALQSQVERATKNRKKSEKDCRFVWKLVQTDNELVLLPDNTEAAKHEKSDFKHKESTRRHGKRRWDRVAVTLYFKRSPGPGQDPEALHRQLRKRDNDSPPRRDNPPETVPVAQNGAPACESIPVAAEHMPPVHHSTRPPPHVPHNTRPAPAPQPGPRPVVASFWSQQIPKVSDSQQDPRLKQAAQSVPPYTEPRAQPTQAYQSASPYSDLEAQAAQFTPASRSGPPHTGSQTHPTQAYQPAPLYSDSRSQAAQFTPTSRSGPPHTGSQTNPTQAFQPAPLYSDSRSQAAQFTQASRSGPPHTGLKRHATQTAQTAQCDPIYGEPRAEPTQSGQRAHHGREPKPKAQPPHTSQPPPMYTDSRARSAEIPPPAQPHHNTKQRHRSEQSYEHPQQPRQPRQQAVPQRTANVPSPTPALSSEPAQYQSRDASLNIPPSMHNVWGRRQSPHRRTHMMPESGGSTASYYDDEEDIFSDSGASMESASQYTFETASPKPAPARPSSDSTARVTPVDRSSSASTARTVRDRWGHSPDDARLPSSKLNPNGPSRPHARAPQANMRPSPGTKRATKMRSTHSDMETPDTQSWGNLDSRGDDWWFDEAQGSPKIESVIRDDLYDDSDEVDEPSPPSQHFSHQQEPRNRNGGRESAGRGGGGRRSMHHGFAPRENR